MSKQPNAKKHFNQSRTVPRTVYQNKSVSGRKKKEDGIAKSVLKGGGRMLGNMIGMGDAGEKAGAYFSRILGMGAYTLNSNSIMRNSTQAPVFDGGDHSFIMSHSELITDVQGSVDFVSRSFPVDPTNVTTFPYLSGIASNFEQYEFLGLVFTYKPTSGSAIASTNNALGTVLLSTEYDVSRPLFIGKVDMEAYQFATSSAPDKMMYHPVECNPKKDVLNSRYTGPNYRKSKASSYNDFAQLGVQDNLEYLGRLQLATVGQQATPTIGELWVSYKIKLSVPRRPGPSSNQGTLHITAVGLPSGSSSAFANSYNVLADSTSALATVSLTKNVGNSEFNFKGTPPGTRLKATLSWTAIGGTIATAPFQFSNVTASNNWMGVSQQIDTSQYTTAGGTAFSVQEVCFILPANSLSNDCKLICQAPTISTGTAQVDVQITIIPYIQGTYPPLTPYVTTKEEEGLEMSNKLLELEKSYQDLRAFYEHDDERRQVLVYEADIMEECKSDPPPSTPRTLRRK